MFDNPNNNNFNQNPNKNPNPNLNQNQKKNYKKRKNNKKNFDLDNKNEQLVPYNQTNDKNNNTNYRFKNNYYKKNKFTKNNYNNKDMTIDYYFYMNPDDLSQMYYYKPNQNYWLENTSNKTNQTTQTNQINSDENSLLLFNTNTNINSNLNNSDKFGFSDEFEKNLVKMLFKELYPESNNINSESEDKQSKIIKKEYKWIELPEIKTLSDLIKIAKQFGEGLTWTDDYEYNINLKLLNSLIPELEELDKMIGLQVVKSQIIDLILYRALGLDEKNHDLLHTVIEGEPGTGKTELAEKIAKIYLKIGILKNNIFKKVKRSDLIAGYLGQTAIKTSKIIEECKGGVLFIDEAYSLGNSEGKDGKDSFSKECIDILNQSLTESKSDFICMIAGYADDLAKSFFSYNSGLERRFPIRFTINPYTDEELGKIFVKKIKELEWDICVSQEDLNQFIKSNRKYFKFNGGDMEILFAKCKISHSKNLLKFENKTKKVLDKKDIYDGIELFKLNPEIKSRAEKVEIKERISSMYI
jgi:ATP-dependent Clp protease ATP-binding subunit ClpA